MQSQIQPFSNDLENWLSSSGRKTLQTLADEFGTKSFAMVFLITMFLPALPIPTGGLTHVFEAVNLLLALELIAGRKSIWLPQKWGRLPLGAATKGKALPFIIKRIKFFEKYSRPRLHSLIQHDYFVRMVGLVVFGLTLSAFLSPPFTGLDTLPAMGVVLISLAVILEDIVLWFLGLAVGATGIAVQLLLAGNIINFVSKLL